MMIDYLRYYAGPACVAVGVTGFVYGGPWMWAGFATYFVLAIADLLLPRDVAERHITNAWLADLPLFAHTALMLALYGAFIAQANSAGGVSAWPWYEIVGAIASLAWLTAVPNLPAQHELLHRRGAFSRSCAFVLGALYGDPLRGLPHIHGHHIHLGTPKDSDTARRGETMYTFPFRATWGSYSDSWTLEKERFARRGLSALSPSNRCIQAIAFEIGMFGAVGWVAGAAAMAVMFAGVAGAKLLIEAFNYYQHFGIVRVPGTAYERRHLWNHLQMGIRAVAFEITNHSDHHMDAFKPFYRLRPDTRGPQMPSVFVCFMAGMIPPLWFRWIAQPRLADWDKHFATEAERALARAANRAAGWPDWSGEDPACGAQAT